VNAICTIVTRKFFPLAKVLYQSLAKHGKEFSFWVLVIDDDQRSLESTAQIKICRPVDLVSSPAGRAIFDKYAHTNKDLLRWALKPVMIAWLLDQHAGKAMFCDPDLYFVNSYEFIFSGLDEADVLLTPHWNNINVYEFEDGLFSIMRNGMFNAGFVAASRKGLPALNWWAGVCHYKMDRQPELGVYDDQKYLDVLPVEFEGVRILRHKGCNLASWNIDTCKRELVNGRLLINREFEPVFIHFAKDTISNILNRNDVLLQPYLDEYRQALEEQGFDLMKNLDLHEGSFHSNPVYKVKHKLRLRTRFKRFLFNLAEKL
jgi:hypothetical protein